MEEDKESTGLTYVELARLLNCHPQTLWKSVHVDSFRGLNNCQRELLRYCAERCDEDPSYKKRLKESVQSDNYIDLIRKVVN